MSHGIGPRPGLLGAWPPAAGATSLRKVSGQWPPEGAEGCVPRKAHIKCVGTDSPDSMCVSLDSMEKRGEVQYIVLRRLFLVGTGEDSRHSDPVFPGAILLPTVYELNILLV